MSIVNNFINSGLANTESAMNQTTKQIESQIDKMPSLDISRQSQQNGTLAGHKTLSPFTWSNLHIKLPKLDKKVPAYSTIQQEVSKEKKKSKVKGRSQQNEKIKLDLINKTINFEHERKKEIKSQHTGEARPRYRKESIESVHRSTNLDKLEEHRVANPEKLRDYKKDLIMRHLQKGLQRNQSPKDSLLNRTSADFSRLRSALSHTSKQNCFPSPQTFSYTKIETYIYKALIKANWCEVASKDPTIVPELVWSDHFLDAGKLGKQQFHNHMENAHALTTKSSLHEMQASYGCEHYPQSFIMPFQYENFCEEYEQNVVKICLKDIIKSAYGTQPPTAIARTHKNLGHILKQLKNRPAPNEDTMMTIRLCLYLENYRKCKNYRYFEHSEQYVPIETKLQSSMLSILLKACHQYWQNLIKNQNNNQNHVSLYFKIANIEPDILEVLWNYNCMLLKLQPSYYSLPVRNAWIVKPIASSRGAGISLLKNSCQFLTINQDRFEMSNKSKYLNKLIQKYIQQPFLLKQPPQFCDRKFDIRQWVLLTCDKSSGEPLIYFYEDGYCRFSDMRFTYTYYRSEEGKIHLTNYSVSDKSNPHTSLMLLSELFANPKYASLKGKYYEQMAKIIVQTVMNAKQLKFEPHKFQLLGYDVILDRSEKLWLLEINLNPACEATRSPKLQQMADKMTHDMMLLVKAASQREFIDGNGRDDLGWRLVYGKEEFREINLSEGVVQEGKIKPFYALSLGNQSLVEEVRKRNFMATAILKTVTKANLRDYWAVLVNYKPIIQEPSQSEQKQPQNVQYNMQQNKDQQVQRQEQASPNQ